MCMCRDSDASAVLLVIWKREDEQHFQHCEQHEQHCEQHCGQREEIKRTNQAALAGGLRTRRWGLISWISLLIFHKGSQWQKDFMVPFGVLWYLLPLLGVAHNSDWCCHLWIFRRVKKKENKLAKLRRQASRVKLQVQKVCAQLTNPCDSLIKLGTLSPPSFLHAPLTKLGTLFYSSCQIGYSSCFVNSKVLNTLWP